MKPKVVLILLTCLCGWRAFGQKPVKESLVLSTPLVIDGIADDWHTDWLMDSRSSILYNVANDSNNLYVRLKISDQVNQQKVLLFGMKLFFNNEGGTKRGKVGLGFPIAKNKDEMKDEQSKDNAHPRSWNEIKGDLIRDAELLELIGLDKDPIVTPRVGLMNGLEVTIAVDPFFDLIYEAKIPFKAFRIDKSKVDDLGILIETGRMQIKPTTSKATYYRGVRYSAPQGTNSSPYTSSTIVHLDIKLH